MSERVPAPLTQDAYWWLAVYCSGRGHDEPIELGSYRFVQMPDRHGNPGSIDMEPHADAPDRLFYCPTCDNRAPSRANAARMASAFKAAGMLRVDAANIRKVNIR